MQMTRIFKYASIIVVVVVTFLYLCGTLPAMLEVHSLATRSSFHALRIYGDSSKSDQIELNNNVALTRNATSKFENESEQDNVIAKRFAKRLEILHSRCPLGYENSPERKRWSPIVHFLVDVPKRLLVCVVPKSGSSTWHGLVWALRRKRAGLNEDQKYYTKNDTSENHKMAKRMSRKDGEMLGIYSPGDEDILHPIGKNRSHRLILARHPFARLISGWKDKFRMEAGYWRKLFERFPLLEKYKISPSPQNFSMAFEDFARYVADNGRSMKALDYHYRPASYICRPCEYPFTYILKAETVDEDQSWLMRRINLTDVNVVRRGVSKTTLLKRNPSDSIKEMFMKLDQETIQKLFKIYEKDFRYFNYSFNFTTFESGGFE